MKLKFLSFWRPKSRKQIRVHFKRVLILCLLVATLYSRILLLSVLQWMFGVRRILTQEELGILTCPACFGIDNSLCKSILNGDITVQVRPVWSNEYTKGVMYGKWQNRDIVIKHLATKDEIVEFDRVVCVSAGSKSFCDLNKSAWNSFLKPTESLEKQLQKTMDCPVNPGLLQMIIGAYGGNKNILPDEKMINLNTALYLNQEAILLQIFPKEDGWPFPKYYGSCGRVILVENGGPNLQSFQKSNWTVRAKIAVKLIELAKKMGDHREWALYITDASLENFSVNQDGEVMLIDVENVIVKDLRWTAIKHTLNDTGDYCPDKCFADKSECLLFSPQDLCQGHCRDHNFYVLCRGILANMKGRDGLLHSAPVQLRTKLNKLLQDCVSGENGNRNQIVDQIKNILEGQF